MPIQNDPCPQAGTEHYLTVQEVGELLGTGDRFVRRLITERRITYIKLGRHVRISETVVKAFLRNATIAAVRTKG